MPSNSNCRRFQLFRRSRGDETILSQMKPFSAFRADILKPALLNNLPNKNRPGGE
jgi:hypothetical protein